jgi:hypothetical protein
MFIVTSQAQTRPKLRRSGTEVLSLGKDERFIEHGI